jgi:hypothetical protein
MPQQEVYFEQRRGEKNVAVLKTYDTAFARDAFEQMKPDALSFLAHSFKREGNVESSENAGEDEFAEDLWQELQEGAREDWNTFSYFIVTEQNGKEASPVFVSSDWPTAEAFATTRLEADV